MVKTVAPKSATGPPKEIKIRHIGNCLQADPAYGKGIADALEISLDEVKFSKELNLTSWGKFLIMTGYTAIIFS